MSLDVRPRDRSDDRVREHWTIVEKSVDVLRQGYDPARPGRVALVRALGAGEQLAVVWMSRMAMAAELRRLSAASGGLEGFTRLAEELLSPVLPTPESFDCIVLAGGLLTHFVVATPDPQQDRLDRVAALVATLRGLRAVGFDASVPPLFGWAVRSGRCGVCRDWERSLERAGLPPETMRVADGHPPGDPCSTCVEEIETAIAVARDTLGLGEADVRSAASPAYVLRFLGLVDDDAPPRAPG